MDSKALIPFVKAFAVGAFALGSVAATAAIGVNFDGVTTGARVNEFYNGGTDSVGGTGPNVGVSFQLDDWFTGTGFGETSEPNFAYSSSGGGTINVAGGFTSSFSFTYGVFVDSTVSIYDGLNGTGALLATTFLAAGNTNLFAPASINFAGTARSVAITSGGNQFGFDDLVFGTGAVPEPSVWTMLILGFGAVGATMRRRTVTVRSTAFA